MDDVFYFSASRVGLDEVVRFIASCGYRVLAQSGRGAVIQYADGGWGQCHWAPAPLDDFSPDDAKDLREQGVQSAFCVSYHPVVALKLAVLLRSVLAEFGGWIGSDEERFMHRYDLASIERLGRP